MTEQNKELFIEFVNFCESQPEDKKIDHSTWSSCAVGEFAANKGVVIRQGFLADFETANCKRINEEELTFIESLLGEEYLYIEDRKGSLGYYLSWGDCPKYYGEFTKFLKQYL